MSAPMENALKDISQSLKQQNRILEAINTNLLAFVKTRSHMGPLDEIVRDRPSFYGWIAADAVEAAGNLKQGDLKLDENNQVLVWNRGAWEELTPNG